jgi:hypothetical protein
METKKTGPVSISGNKPGSDLGSFAAQSGESYSVMNLL